MQRESLVEAIDWKQETKPSCAEICAGEAGSDQASKEVPGRESPVEAPDWEQVAKPSCAEICSGEPGSDKPDEAPDDACQGMGTTRDARIAGEEIPRGEEKEVSDLAGDKAAELGRHVEATSDGRGVQAAESSSKEVTGKDSPVKAPDWEQVAKPSCAESCAEVPGLDRPAHDEMANRPAQDKMANSSRAEVAGIESPVEAPYGGHWEQETKPSCAEVHGLDRPQW